MYLDPPQTGAYCSILSGAQVFALPADTKTHQYSVNVKLQKNTNVIGTKLWTYVDTGAAATESFCFSVFSETARFGDIEASTNNLSINSSALTGDNNDICPPYNNISFSMDGSVDFFESAYNYGSSGTMTAAVTDVGGYLNIQVASGYANITNDPVETTVEEFPLTINNVILNSSGGYYSSAVLDLPDSVTAHERMDYNGASIINPKGKTTLFFPSGNFQLNNFDNVIFSLIQKLYLHSEGIPFYVKTDSFRYDVSNNRLYFADPEIEYVHHYLKEPGVVDAGDRRGYKGFPTNDGIFTNAMGVTDFGLTRNGLTGLFDFDKSDAMQTFFPRSEMSHEAFSATVVDGVLGMKDDAFLIVNQMRMRFGRNCDGGNCGDYAEDLYYRFPEKGNAGILSNGAFGYRFPQMPDPENGAGVQWGGFESGDPTFSRNDKGAPGIVTIPGFIIPGSGKGTDPVKISEMLFASFTYSGERISDYHILDDSSDRYAKNGDGFFAGITLGPEFLVGKDYNEPIPEEGAGVFLGQSTGVRFNGNNYFTDMEDREAVKYVLRPGGLTGLFNTSFKDLATIYGYEIEFYRFAFRQDRNTLDDETFIDGELTLNGLVGGSKGMRVGFANLALTCQGNLDEGEVDSEEEPGWPREELAGGGDGVNGDGDSNTDEGCQVLEYWNMPILYLGMAFENDPADTSGAECNTLPRKLSLTTRNKVDGIKHLLTMNAFYPKEGTIEHQTMTGEVDNIFDSPTEGDKEGFSIRLQKAYLNQASIPSPSWEGFTVISGYTDVPLFDDVRLAGHFINNESTNFNDFGLLMFQDATDSDTEFAGAPFGTTVTAYRDLLAASDKSVLPFFEYEWPSSGLITLDYNAKYVRASGEEMPRFEGMQEVANLADVLKITSVPDYINPERTKFSFGASADMAALNDVFLDVSNLSGNLNDFLTDTLNVDGALDLEGKIAGIINAEQIMHDLTGGDLTDLFGKVIDKTLQENPCRAAISGVSEYLNLAQQAVYRLEAVATDPLTELQDRITGQVTGTLAHDFNDIYTDIAPLYFFNPDDLQGVPGAPSSSELEALRIRKDEITRTVEQIVDRLNEAKSVIGNIREFTDAGSNSLSDLAQNITDAQAQINNLYNVINSLTDYTSTDISINPIFIGNGAVGGITKVITSVRDVNDAIDDLNIVQIADALKAAAQLAGSSIDMTMVDSAVTTVNTAVNQLNEAISSAEDNVNNLFGSTGVSNILDDITTLLSPGGIINTTLGNMKLTLDKLKLTEIDDMLADTESGLDTIITTLNGLSNQATSTELPASWAEAISSSQASLDEFAQSVAASQQNAGTSLSSLLSIIEATPDLNFNTVFDTFLSDIINTPFNVILDTATPGSIANIIEELAGDTTILLVSPSEEDIRNMIRTFIMNTGIVQDINSIVYEQLGFVTDIIDNTTTQLTTKINDMIKEAIAVISEGLSQQLESITANVGPDEGGSDDWTGIKAAKMDGYAIVSQDEIERLHVEAEFTFDGEPDDTTYNAALDVTSWNSEDGKSDCITPPGSSSGNVDIVISTHDISAEMLGMDVGIKEAALGFTMNGLEPIGVIGRVYLLGEINFEVLVLEDLGLESAFGKEEIYFGATGAGRFRTYTIPKAAFFLGRSCDFEVLRRLDSEVADFIGEIVPLEGVFVRGSIEIPLYDFGCMFRVGVGADIGAWFFTQPSPGTYGGLVGGSAYGRLACLAALKGKVTCMGQKSGSDYKFMGDGWAAAGVGWCSPSSWKSVRDARKDSWCLTGDATFNATYDGSWEIDGPKVNCCD